jgi:hypothetical protein
VLDECACNELAVRHGAEVNCTRACNRAFVHHTYTIEAAVFVSVARYLDITQSPGAFRPSRLLVRSRAASA